ncbi:MAG: hypothetical protein J6U81_07620, partial [Bacteroidales bacterium]|nr:hypothetical protein [Bacteroidales bacterium]
HQAVAPQSQFTCHRQPDAGTSSRYQCVFVQCSNVLLIIHLPESPPSRVNRSSFLKNHLYFLARSGTLYFRP